MVRVKIIEYNITIMGENINIKSRCDWCVELFINSDLRIKYK
jgi:hypothetical protein